MKRRFFAVLRVASSTAFKEVFSLCNKVIKGLMDNVAVFSNPQPTVDKLVAENEILEDLMTEAETGNHQKVQERNKQSKIVHGLLRTETSYVDLVADGDRSIILLSGFEASNEPEPQPVPEKVVIRRIVDGSFEHSAKVFIEALARRDIYIVEITTDTVQPLTWDRVLQTGNSRKLIIEDLERGVEVFIRVAAFNTAGQGPWSDPMVFLPR